VKKVNLSRETYYSPEANLRYMSVSQFKSFVPAYGGCEARAMAILRGEYEEPDKTVFDEGHFLHAWNEGKLDEFKANNPHLYSTRGPTAGQLKANFQHCERMIEVLEADPLVMKALAGEKEVIMTAELFGVEWKIMIDSYQPDVGIFTDLKVLREIDGKWWNKEAQAYENFIDHYGYHIQMAVYAEVEKRVTGRENWLIPHMVIVTKQDPPDHEIVYFDYDAIEAGIQIVQNHIDRVIAVKSREEPPTRCERCDYCRKTKRIKRIKHYAELSLY